MTCGIYSILNKTNGKIYVGQSSNIEDRWHYHRKKLRKSFHYNTHLQNAWNKYGEDSFEFDILEKCSYESLNDNERWWIEYFESNNKLKGYNLTSGGDCDYSFNDSTLKKLSRINSGKNNYFYGKKHSLNTRIHMSKSKNTSGYYRVCKITTKRYAQGFCWAYQWIDEVGKTCRIKAKTIDDLKKKVVERNLEWIKLSDSVEV